ncbi:MAG: hypothetical protein ACR2PX_29170 [Endozoicomonas sp.]|uniref:hypothetical protein n=1 Tax=Endozoicomonas sp. TaxID=1892382 RepID=UPI003D9B6A7D
MEQARKIIGLFLIIVGSVMLILLVVNFETYILNFNEGSIYQLLSEESGEPFIVSFNGNEIKADGGNVSIIALIFTFLFLNIWLKIGGKLLSAGSRLFSPELEELGNKIDQLTSIAKDKFRNGFSEK